MDHGDLTGRGVRDPTILLIPSLTRPKGPGIKEGNREGLGPQAPNPNRLQVLAYAHDHPRLLFVVRILLLLDRALADAKKAGHRLVILVGDEPYYSRVGFKTVPKGRAIMPGPVDYARLLVAELVDGAFEGVSGEIRPDWSKAR